MAGEYSSAFLEGIFLLTKILIGLGIAVAIVFTTYFVVQQNMILAALSILGMFTLTNMLRAIAFSDRGMMQEAKLMRILSIVCIIGFTGIGIFSIFT